MGIQDLNSDHLTLKHMLHVNFYVIALQRTMETQRKDPSRGRKVGRSEKGGFEDLSLPLSVKEQSS